MTASSSFFRPLRRARLAHVLLACALTTLTPGLVRAASDEQPHELEEKTSAELEKLKPLLDAKNWEGALQIVRAARSGVKPESYDMALLSDIEAKLELQKGDYAKAIEPWETAIRLSDQHNYLDENSVQEDVYYLAQIYYQEATAAKTPVKAQAKDYERATALLDRWFAHTKKPPTDSARQDAMVFYASVLYNRATIDQNHVDQALLAKAEDAVEQGLRMVSRPKEQLYQLLLAIAQQKNDYLRLADLLELLVKHHPQKKDYWSELAGVYLNLAGNEKNEDLAREYNIRAVLTIERAQALNFMRSPKENYTLVGIFYNIGQFGRATELLHSGLRNHTIDSEETYWALLGSSYQQADRPYAAVEALKEGAKNFPQSGQLDYQRAQILYSLNKAQESYDALQEATKKGHLDKPGAVYGFLGYVSWELGKLYEARDAVDKALESPDGKKDHQLPVLKKAIAEAIREKEAAKGNAKSV